MGKNPLLFKLESSNYHKRDLKAARVQQIKLLLLDDTEAESQNKMASMKKRHAEQKAMHVLNSCHLRNNT